MTIRDENTPVRMIPVREIKAGDTVYFWHRREATVLGIDEYRGTIPSFTKSLNLQIRCKDGKYLEISMAVSDNDHLTAPPTT